MSEVLACCNDIYVFTDIVGVFKCKEFKDFANITEPAPMVVIFDEYGCETRVLIKDIEKYFEMCIKTLKPFETIVGFKGVKFEKKETENISICFADTIVEVSFFVA